MELSSVSDSQPPEDDTSGRKMAHMEDPVRLVNLVICLHLKLIRACLELAREKTKSVHPKSLCVMGPNNRPIP